MGRARIAGVRGSFLALAVSCGCSGGAGGQDQERAVGAEAVFLQGALPSTVAGAPACEHGLLIGLPGGLTLEYRADDVRLLGVRRGGFARLDGGIEPLGELVLLHEGGRPGASYALAPGTGELREEELVPLLAELEETWTRGAGAGLRYALREPGGRVVARVEESVRALLGEESPGFGRLLVMASAGERVRVAGRMTLFSDLGAETVAGTFSSGPLCAPDWSLACGQTSLTVGKDPDRTDLFRAHMMSRPDALGSLRALDLDTLTAEPGDPARFEEAVMFLASWDEAGQEQLRVMVRRPE